MGSDADNTQMHWLQVAELIRALDPSESFRDVTRRLATIRDVSSNGHKSTATVTYMVQSGSTGRSRFEVCISNTASCWSLERAARVADDITWALALARALDEKLAPWVYDHNAGGGIAVRVEKKP